MVVDGAPQVGNAGTGPVGFAARSPPLAARLGPERERRLNPHALCY
jgi:hypothetical protein